jgi:hypothetical protein
MVRKLNTGDRPELAEQASQVAKVSCDQHFSSQFFRTLHLSASDPRDRIFGILGISSFSGTYITPDYTKSTEEVVLDAAIAMLRERRLIFYYLMPLQPSRDSVSLEGASVMPSWVPDLLCARAPYTTGRYSFSARGSVYNLPDDILYMSPVSVLDRMCSMLPFPPATFSPNLRMLYAPGILIGTIVETSCEPSNHLDETIRKSELPENIQQFYHSILGPRGIAMGSMIRLFTGERPGPDWPAAIKAFDTDVSQAYISRNVRAEMEIIVEEITRGVKNRVILVMDNNHIGLAYHPNSTGGIRPGDVIAGLFGINFPFILRPMGNAQYRMINVARVPEMKWRHEFLGIKPSYSATPSYVQETQRKYRKEHRKDASDISWRDYEHHGMREFAII